MQWTQHGEYALRRQGDVLVVKTDGDWNEVAVQNLARDAQAHWPQLAGRHWGLFVDARGWCGSSPDTLRAWQAEFIERGALAAGAAAIAVVLPDPLFFTIVRQASQRLHERCPSIESLDVDEAWRWMAAQQVDCG